MTTTPGHGPSPWGMLSSASIGPAGGGWGVVRGWGFGMGGLGVVGGGAADPGGRPPRTDRDRGPWVPAPRAADRRRGGQHGRRLEPSRDPRRPGLHRRRGDRRHR